ncbi:MAG: MFS transporter [Bacteroidales bacterium]|nr:MFS transporter [Bacteroidales bacterium]
MEQIKKIISDSPVARWGILLLISFTMAVNYYFYDAISPLKQLLTEKLGFSSSDYGFFISAYSFPNVFLLMAVLGGIIADKFGIRITGSTFVLFMLIGSIITAYGATDYYNDGGIGYGFMNSFLVSYSPGLKMMSLGFLIFGLGAETSIVVITKIVVKWFKGKELALALGINLAIARLGSALSLNITPMLIEPNWTTPIWFGALLMAIGVLTFLAYLIFDVKIDKQKISDNIIDEEPFRFADIIKLLKNPSFIYISLLCVTFYSAVFPFIKYAPDLLQNKFGLSISLSSNITSMVYYGTILFTPIFGWFTDNKGKSATIMIFGSILLIFVHLTISLTNITPYVPMFMLGIAFSLIPAAMWPAVAKIVDESRLGTAYGLMFSIQNIGLWAFPILIGLVLDKSNPGVAETIASGGSAVFDYTNPILMLAFLGVLGFIFAILLKRADKKSEYGLELPNIQN